MSERAFSRGDLLTGQSGTYAIRALIDQGGVGAVYDAQRTADRARVAIKVLHGGRFPITAVARERFRTEIANTLRLRHKRLVETYDFGRADEHDFLVMEHVAGGTVASRIKPGQYDDATALKWCGQILEGLSYLHGEGFIHRDLKPNNLLLTESGDLKIGDLGIIRDLSADAYLTMTGDQIGSVLYISRHQRENPGEANLADDAHAASCCLYEIISRQRIHVYPEHLRAATEGRFPAYLCDLIMGCLAGHEPVEAIAELTRLLPNEGDAGSGLKEAQSHEINIDILSLASADRNAGLQRRRLATVAPLALAAELTVSTDPKDGAYRATFLTEDLLMIAPDVMNSHGEYLVGLMRVSEQRIERIDSVSIESPFRVIRDSKGRLVTACTEGVRVYEAEDSGRLREVAKFRFPGIKFHAMTMAASPALPLVVIGEWGAAPVILNIKTGEWRRLRAEPDVVWNGLGETAFLGSHTIVLQHNPAAGLTAYDIGPDGADCVVGRWGFPRELSDIEADQTSGTLFACHRAGLECFAAEDGQRRWVFTPPTCVNRVSLNPAGTVLAIQVGLLDGGRIAVIDTREGTLAYLPDTGDRDTLRRAQHVDWSPSGTRLCVSDQGNCISIFSR